MSLSLGRSLAVSAAILVCLALLVVPSSSRAEDQPVTIQPIPSKPDQPVTIQPVPYPDQPVTILPIPSKPDQPVTTLPIWDDRDTNLYLWITRDGRTFERKVLVCRSGCRVGKALLRLTRADFGQQCVQRNYGPARAGGYYQGQRIGTFTQTNSCRMRQWRKAAVWYNRYF